MKAGFNKLDITPKIPCRMAGFSRTSLATGVLDPIEINSFVFGEGDSYGIISLLDSIITEDCIIVPVRRRVSRALHIPEERITIGCIHTHSAPAYFKPYFENVEEEHELKEALKDQFFESIMNAFDSLSECSFKLEVTEIDGEYGNRNTKEGDADKNIYNLTFTREGEANPWFSFCTIACHPTILDGRNTLLSADLIGQLRLEFEEQFGHPCMFANGCCGDVSTRFYRKGSGAEELQRMSCSIIKQMKENSVERNVDYQPPVFASVHDLMHADFAAQDFCSSEIDRLSQAIETHKDSPAANYESTLLNALQTKALRSPFDMPLQSQCCRMGSLLILTLCGDISSGFAKKIRAAFPANEVIIIGYCHNYSNYFVCEPDYGKYFETYISRLEKGDADRYINDTIAKANTLLS